MITLRRPNILVVMYDQLNPAMLGYRGGPAVMVRRGALKFVHCPADLDQLYDVVEDPHERVNLAADPQRASVVATFRAEGLSGGTATACSTRCSPTRPVGG